MTPRELIQWTEARFLQSDLYYGHGTDNALDEAVYLVLAGLDLPIDCSDEMLDTVLESNKEGHINNLVQRRVEERIQVAYLINKAWFAGHEFYVDERVLIPRSPMAELIDEQFSPWLNTPDVNRILDIGSGSGCIAIACAYAFPDAEVDAVEINNEAAQVLGKNISRHHKQDRVHLIESDLFRNIESGQYDLIVSNPPYVSVKEMRGLPKEYKHEPVMALEANNNGLDIVTRILHEASAYLNDGGILVIEVGNSQEALVETFPKVPFVWLEFKNGGEGVFLLTKQDLLRSFSENR